MSTQLLITPHVSLAPRELPRNELRLNNVQQAKYVCERFWNIFFVTAKSDVALRRASDTPQTPRASDTPHMPRSPEKGEEGGEKEEERLERRGGRGGGRGGRGGGRGRSVFIHKNVSNF